MQPNPTATVRAAALRALARAIPSNLAELARRIEEVAEALPETLPSERGALGKKLRDQIKAAGLGYVGEAAEKLCREACDCDWNGERRDMMDPSMIVPCYAH